MYISNKSEYRCNVCNQKLPLPPRPKKLTRGHIMQAFIDRGYDFDTADDMAEVVLQKFRA